VLVDNVVIACRCTMLGAAMTILASCGARDAAQDAPNDAGGPKVGDPPYEVTPASEVVPLKTEMLRSIPLGTNARETPIGVSRVWMTGDRIAVLDEAGRTIRGYNRGGTALFSSAFGRGTGVDVREPVALAMRSDTTFILDLDGRIAALSADGRQTNVMRTGLPSSTVDYVPDGDGFLIATIAKDSAIASGSAAIVWRVTRDARREVVGCHPDDLYRTSIGHKGMFQAFRFFGVSASKDLVYCRQPLTPLVQIVDTRTKATQYLRRAPPFYRRPSDIPETMNQARVNDLRAQWTEHARFIPLPSGFVSFYTTFDGKDGRDRYLMFMCDSTSGATRCGTAEVPQPPLAFLAPDTLVTASGITASSVVRALSLYRVHF